MGREEKSRRTYNNVSTVVISGSEVGYGIEGREGHFMKVQFVHVIYFYVS